MNKTQKSEIVNTLTEEFKSANAVVMCDYRGLTVGNLESLRKIAREKDTKVQVVKNTLATIALNNAGMSGIDIVDTNIFVGVKMLSQLLKQLLNLRKQMINSHFEQHISMVKRQMKQKFVRLQHCQDVKNYLECSHLFGWDQFVTLQSDSMRLRINVKKKPQRNCRFEKSLIEISA